MILDKTSYYTHLTISSVFAVYARVDVFSFFLKFDTMRGQQRLKITYTVSRANIELHLAVCALLSFLLLEFFFTCKINNTKH